jgi:formylglycine-generating enzyme required for sulfatase activity
MGLRLFTSFAFQLPGPGGVLLALDGRHFVFFALLLLGLCGSANAKRVALVIGNDQYQTIAKLSNARNDASLIASVLTKAGFAVTQANDLGRERLWSTIDAFKAGVNKGDEVVFYFAGHGVQIGPAQLLLATDINSRTEAQLQRDGVPLVDVQDALKDARVAIFIIDACRDNPFPKQGLRSLGATRGLLPPEPSAGQIIMMSAGRNQKALDSVPGQTRANGLFTWELAQVIQTPGIEIRSAMERVKDAVDDKARAANHEQRPSLVNDLRGNFYFFASPVAATDNTVRPGPVVVAPALTAAQLEEKFWDDAKAAGNRDAFEAYLESYPKGRYVSLARANIARLSNLNVVIAPIVKVPPVVAPVITPPVTKPVITNPARVPGTVFKDCDDCPEMVVIPAGSFEMGGTLPIETPRHRVTLRAFSMGRTEVTQGQWRSIMGTSPSKFSACGDTCPVETVSWADAQAFVKKLSAKTGKQYRLSSEAEWEYACRAGGQDKYCGSGRVNDVGWYDANSGGSTRPVGGKQANAWGLHDMSGNVWEWTEDCWKENYNGAPTDGSAWTTGNCSQRVLRGGSWGNDPQDLRAADRGRDSTAIRNDYLGFRVARTH